MPHSLESKIDQLIDAFEKHAESNFALAASVAALAEAIASDAPTEDDAPPRQDYGGLAD
ncbi:hypothetical protein [Pandoraea sp. CB10b_02]|uniref:hypothetical protein n=1 Tax=Pandoraea sp. CB10b_02 TaxID=2014535 RepID=UPI00257D2FE2|nr:hypothetical protein [Pandoraea sp. CB10b_02]